MAKIILNVDLNAAPAQKELKALENAIKGIADTLSNVKADKNLTAQINALTKNYTTLANAAQKVTKTNNQNAISEEKLAREKEKTRKSDRASQSIGRKVEPNEKKSNGRNGKTDNRNKKEHRCADPKQFSVSEKSNSLGGVQHSRQSSKICVYLSQPNAGTNRGRRDCFATCSARGIGHRQPNCR